MTPEQQLEVALRVLDEHPELVDRWFWFKKRVLP